jgi:N-methylhydantoinase B
MSQPLAIDSITASVVQGALENIAVEMGYKLMRMSYSSIIRESEDFGAALVDAEGRGLVDGGEPWSWLATRCRLRHRRR